ncbi:LysR family transcriptional regulator [Bradyrhizobium sp. U531]|uniref:LysR family transcriptional regulator n=1 Tax=Bradyrhizobium sp. U531 TaxID=3053458 RepID=UPI003F41F3ED
MDRLHAMSVLLAAVECGSLSKASKRLRLPLATVSRKVSELEEHLNATLLTRSAKGLELTPAGRSYVTAAKSILEQLNEAERAAAGEYVEPKGDLVVTAPIMFGRLNVLPVVTRFLDAFPDVSVGLVLTDRVAHFLEDQVDVAIRIGSLPDSSLVATRLGTVRHIVCASPDYIAAHGAPHTPEDLAKHRVISFQSISALSSWTFEAAGVEISTTFSSRLSVNTIDAAIDAALSGAGLVRAVSYQVAEHVRAGRLALVLEKFEPQARPVHLVYDSQNRLPLKLRAFVDFVVPRLRQRLVDVMLHAHNSSARREPDAPTL